MSALGAGALALTADHAEASVIASGPINLQVGFGCGCNWTSFSQASLIGANQSVFMAMFTAYTSVPLAPSRRRGFLAVKAMGAARTVSDSTPHRFDFRVTSVAPLGSLSPTKFLKLFAAGAQWRDGTAIATGTPFPRTVGDFGIPVAHRIATANATTTTASAGQYPDPINPANRYAMFSFSDTLCPGGACYGWADFDIAITPDGPNVTLRSWAYDDSGAFLQAGDAGVPEPSTAALMGIAALALGARGIRRWRAARPS